jgi:polysaccharide export outer membrane protein
MQKIHMPTRHTFLGQQQAIKVSKVVMGALLLSTLSGCALFNTWLPGSGPIRSDVGASSNAGVETDPSAPTVQLIDITERTLRQVNQAQKRSEFASLFQKVAANRNLVGPGDVLEVNIWEASPAMLFGSTSSASLSIVNASSSKATTLPEQMVSLDGTITIPFVGSIQVIGKSTQAIGTEITTSLKGKANFPQVLVRMTRNTTSAVTVVGEVNTSQLIPLTPKQEKLLDAIAASGGVKQPINKITIQLARNGQVHSMPLESVIKDPKQNIPLTSGDVITAYFQPYSFTALGATGQNQEITFEAQGISLVQALARVGGVQDNRADARGVFIFRFEEPEAVPEQAKNGIKTAENKVPVIYRMNLTDGSAFLTAQNFAIKNKDVLYVSNASSVELQKFLNILVSAVYPIVNVGNIAAGN